MVVSASRRRDGYSVPRRRSSPVTRFALRSARDSSSRLNDSQTWPSRRTARSSSTWPTAVVPAVDVGPRGSPSRAHNRRPRRRARRFRPTASPSRFTRRSTATIKKIAVSGGAAVTICPADGSVWAELGHQRDHLRQAAKASCACRQTAASPKCWSASRTASGNGPQMLPGGEWVLFTIATADSGQLGQGADRRAVVEDVGTKDARVGGSDARYLPTGHIVYALGGVLFAVPFDLRHLDVTGGPVPIVEGVKRATGNSGARVSASPAPGPSFTSRVRCRRRRLSDLALIDRRAGTAAEVPLGPYDTLGCRRTASGSRSAARTARTRVCGSTTVGRERAAPTHVWRPQPLPVWSADSERVAFQSDREGDSASSGSAPTATPAERLTKPDKGRPTFRSRGRPMARRCCSASPRAPATRLGVVAHGGRYTLWRIQSPIPPDAAFSPDGRWVAYSAGTSGRSRPVRPTVSDDRREVSDFESIGATIPFGRPTGRIYSTSRRARANSSR